MPVRGRLGAAVHAHVETYGRIGSQVRHRVAVAQSSILLERQTGVDDPKPRGILDREHPPHHGVDQAEDGCVRADPQRKGERHRRREARPLHQDPNCVSDIPPDRVNESDAPRLAAFFLEFVGTTHLDSRTAHGLLL